MAKHKGAKIELIGDPNEGCALKTDQCCKESLAATLGIAMENLLYEIGEEQTMNWIEKWFLFAKENRIARENIRVAMFDEQYIDNQNNNEQ